ncbi:MAG: choice-of-anchor L domain-containing protein [Crocinitomicaceae bacterium]|nr:choice-of-anchor L domain-containing protein [Crocinitomicaceae bacterium]
MKTLFKALLVAILLFACVPTMFSQITMTGGQTAQQLAEFLAGPNITVTNAVLSQGNTVLPTLSSAPAAGTFAGVNSDIGFDSGVILSSGNITEAPGPNTSANTGADLGYSGTTQMNGLAGVNTFDAITLEFDFEVQSSFIQFNYVFASEEYPEFAPPNNSSFNDVFAFFISGPGIVGEQNIALVPNSTSPVAINNINPVTNSQYYIDNSVGLDIEFDGFTTILEATRNNLTPCEVYHLKLVITDAGDGVYSSAVFLQENSLVQGLVDVQTQTINADDIALEGCIPASFTFSYDDVSNQDRIINYYVGGTAVNGVDYQYVDSSLTIVAGDTSATIYIDAFSDGLTEGQESIWIIYQPAACADFDTAYLYINDAQPIDFSLDEYHLDCFEDNSGEILVNSTGGFPPYTYYVTDPNGVETQTTANPITGLAAGTYTVQVYDSYGCQADALVIGGIYDADTTFLPDVPNGSVITYDAPLNITGFTAGQTINDVSQIQQICATMEHSYLGDLQITVEAPSGQVVVLKQQNGGGSCDLGQPFASAPVDGANSNLTDPGIGYEYCFNANPIFLTMVGESNNFTHTIPSSTGGTYTDNYLPAGSYTPFGSFNSLIGADMNGTWEMHVTDQFALDNGYIFNWYISLIGDMPDTTVTLLQPSEIVTTGFVTDATCGGSDGSIDINIQDAVLPYTVSWSNGATTEDLVGVAAGTYTVTVTDGNGCQSQETFIVNNIGSLSIASTSTPASCFGGSDGTIDITPAGGSTPYTFSWDSGQSTEDISGLSAGDYTVTMTDQLGCVFSELITVGESSQIMINAVSVFDEECNTDNGSIDISVSGGTGSFGYQWSNGSTSQDISGLTAATYTVNVVDGNGCTANESYTIVNDVSNCSAFCFIEVEANVVTDELCGAANGSIDINVLNAVAPVSYSWSNGATTEDITGLSAGTYTVVATDANNCSEVMTFTVLNDAGTLEISNASVGVENCGNLNGSIDITVVGGAMPYTYDWSNGATTEDITGLAAGTYDITITDGNGCETSASYVVANNAGSLAATATVLSEICTAANGSIDQTITGGNGVLTFAWDSGQTTEDLSNLPAGTYNCTITDETGCYIIQPYTVTQTTGDISVIGVNIVNEVCGNGQGEVNITVTGNNLTFVWSNGATTEDLTGVSAGDYSCVISNAQGCTYTTPLYSVINASGTLNVTTQLVTDEICGNNGGAINMNITGGTAPFTISWSNGATSEDIVGLSAGTYSITVTDANGCTESQSVTVNSNSGTLAIQNAIITDELCGDQAGAIDVITIGGTGTLTYSWSSGQSSEDLSGLAAGTYTITITDQNGCTATETYTVNNQASGLAFTSAITNEICSNGQGQITLTVSGGNAPYTYAWSNGGTTATITGLSSGLYSCTITDNSGCSIVTGDLSVGNTANGLSASTTVVDANCSNNGSIDLTVNGGALPLTFSWSNGATTEDISGLAGGTYDYTVTDNNSCVVTGSVTVLQTNGNITYTFTTTSEICGNGVGAIDLTPSGGVGPYTFVWSNGPTTEDLSGLSAGTYTCDITDNTGCTITTAAISVTDLPGTLSITNLIATDETCSNGLGSIDISVSGGAAPITYSWSNGPTTQDVTNLTSGTYDVTVTDNNGCQVTAQAAINSASGSFAITQPIVTDENCSNGQGAIDISVTGQSNPVTFVWSNGATTEDISGLSAGVYSVTATDNNGCVETTSYTVSNSGASLSIGNANVTDEYCGSGSGSVTITVSGGTAPFNYVWSNGGTTNGVDNLSAGTYTVTVTDGSGCQVQGTYTVTNNPGNLALTAVVTDENCGDGQGAIDITTTGGNLPLLYAWSSGQTTEDIGPVSEGTYDLVITDQFGCTANYNGVVANITGGLGVTVTSVTDENCGQSDGAIDITTTGTGIISTVWSSGQTTEDITAISAGTYTVTVSTATCSVTETVTVVNQTGTLATTFTYIQDENCGDAQGFIDIDVTGAGPFTYLWSNGQTTQDAIGLSGGTYSVTITDNNGCDLTETFTVNSTNITNMTASGTTTDILCATDDGAIDLSVSGGIGPFTYLWSNGSTTQDISNLPVGSYTVVVTDAASCTATEILTIGGTQQSNLGFTNININDEDCGNQDGSMVYFTGGTADDYYLDGVNLGGFNATNLSAGTYLAAITDNLGCYADTIVTVGSTGNFNLTSTSVDETCGQSNGSIDVTVTGGTGMTYLWDSGQTTQDLTGVPAGTYTLTATDNTNCSVQITVDVVNQTGAFGASLTSLGNEDCQNGQGFIDIDVVGTGPFTYAWDSGQTTQDITGLSAGTYSVTITDGAGCQLTESYQVDNNATYSVSAVIVEEFCTSVDGSINLTLTGGAAPYTFTWSNGATTEDLFNVAAGTYTVTIADAFNCQSVETFVVPQGSNGIQLTNFVIVNDFCGQGIGDVNFNSGGTVDDYYIDGVLLPSSHAYNLTAGTYVISGTDNQGCYVEEIVTVGNDVNFTLSQTTTDETCGQFDGAIDVTASTTGLLYSWDSGQTTEDLLNVAAGTYTVTATDNVGCSVSLTSTIANQTGTLGITSGIVTDENCQDGQGAIDIDVAGTGPFIYTWSSGQTTQDITGLTAGTYTVIVADGSGCQLTESYTVNDNASYTVTAAITEEFCTSTDGEIDLTVIGAGAPISFAWDNGATTEDLTGLVAGDYTVVITDGSGCQFTETYTVTQGSTGLQLVNFQITDENCGNGDGEVDFGSGGTADDYYIDGVLLPSSDADNLSAGTYVISATDNQGCYVDSTITIGSTGTFTLSHVTTHESCELGNGAIDLTVTGGSTMSYAWSNGATTQDLTGLSAGTYSLTATSTGGGTCTVDYTVIVNNDNSFEITSSQTDDYCGALNGVIDQQIIFGAGLTYSWNTGQTTQDLTGITAGTYTCTITDPATNGCTFSYDYTIGNGTNGMTPTESITNEFCSYGDGAIDLTMSGGTGSFSFAWDNGATTEDISSLAAGTYVVTITDLGDNCQMTVSYDLTNSATMVATEIITNDQCTSGVGAIDLTMSAGSGNYTFAWDNGETTEDISNLSPGTYSVLIIDVADNCQITEVYVVGDTISTLAATASITDELCNDGAGEIDLTVTGDAGPYSYSWDNGEITEDITNLSAGNYEVTVTDQASGCTITETYTVGNSTVIFGGSAVIVDATCMTCADGSIDVTLNPGAYTYSWASGETTEDLSNLNPGTYTLTVSLGGCDTTMVFEVLEMVSLDEESLLSISMTVHPNPAYDHFNVNYVLPAGEEGKIIVTDAFGRLIEVHNVSGADQFTISTVEKAMGVYFVTLESKYATKVERVVVGKK